MTGIAWWCFRHRWVVLAVWLIALIAFPVVGRAAGTAYSNTFSLAGTDSGSALNVLKADFPARAGDSEQIVVQARQGTLRSPAVKTTVTSMLAKVSQLPHVVSVASPDLRARLPRAQRHPFLHQRHP